MSSTAPVSTASPAARPAGERQSVIASYAIAIARALEHKGVDSRRVFRAAGISETLSNDPLHRLPGAQIGQLYRACVQVTGDPYFGLTVAKFIHASNIHAMGYALLASKTLLDFCLRLERYFAVVSGSVMLRVERHDTEVALRFHHLAPVCGENEDACLAFLLHFMRLLYRADFQPVCVAFRHACPTPGAAPYAACFGVRRCLTRPRARWSCPPRPCPTPWPVPAPSSRSSTTGLPASTWRAWTRATSRRVCAPSSSS